MSRTLEVTDRTRVRRRANRASYDRAVIDPILDEALVCHVAFPNPGGAPAVIPTTFVRVDDTIYIHGAAASHMLRTMASGVEISVAVTLLDALVLARTAFHHSVNYRSVVLFGRATLVEDRALKLATLAALLDKVVPGRSAGCRAPDAAELDATKVLALAIEEGAAKIRAAPPLADEGPDAALPYWAGVVPFHVVRGAPTTAPDCSLPPPPTAGPSRP